MSSDIVKILLVDDHPVVREGLRTMLRTIPGVQVVAERSDGREAVQAVASHRPDVVLMDIRMPNMDGLEATRLIKTQFPHTAVVILTMYDNDAMVVDAVRAGACGYLLKDASRELLTHTIQAASSGGTLIKTGLLRKAASCGGQTPVRAAAGEEEAFSEFTIEALSAREREVLQILVEGGTNKEIAATLLIGGDTVKKHVQNIIAKLGAADRTQAAVRAVRMGLVK